MKKLLKYILIVSTGLLLFSSCEDSKTYDGPVAVRLLTSSADFYINQSDAGYDTYTIKVQAVGVVPSSDVVINVTVNADATDAVGGVHYNLPATVTIPAGKTEGELTIEGIYSGIADNSVHTLSFTLTSDKYTILPSYSTATITFRLYTPLTPWIGTYTGTAVSQTEPGDWDEIWAITVAIDNSDPQHKLKIYGLAKGSAVGYVGIVDFDAGTITFDGGVNLGDTYGYGDVTVYYGYYDGSYHLSSTAPIVGAIDSDNYTIVIPNFGELLTSGSYAGNIWDVFDVTIAKASKAMDFVPALKKPIKLN